MTLIKKSIDEKKKISFEVVFGIAIILLVLILVALFFPILTRLK